MTMVQPPAPVTGDDLRERIARAIYEEEHDGPWKNANHPDWVQSLRSADAVLAVLPPQPSPSPVPPADDSAPLEVKRRTRREVTDDFIEGTRTIREWVNGGGVDGPRLCEELDAWLDYWGGWTPHRAAALDPESSTGDGEGEALAAGDQVHTLAGGSSGPPADDLVSRARRHADARPESRPVIEALLGRCEDEWERAEWAVHEAERLQRIATDLNECLDLANAEAARLRTEATITPVPPWPGAVLSGLCDEDGEPTWLAQAGQVPGEQVRCSRNLSWTKTWGYGPGMWVEVRAPRAVPEPEPERVTLWEALGRVGPGGDPFVEVGFDGEGPWVRVVEGGTKLRSLVAPDGTVEVLKDGDR